MYIVNYLQINYFTICSKYPKFVYLFICIKLCIIITRARFSKLYEILKMYTNNKLIKTNVKQKLSLEEIIV